LPMYLLPLWILTLGGLGLGYIYVHSIWFAIAAFLIFAAYVGGTIAFTALYVARTYKNSLHRPNAIIDRKKSVFQPAPLGEAVSVGRQQSFEVDAI
jgi:hypothetical protein